MIYPETIADHWVSDHVPSRDNRMQVFHSSQTQQQLISSPFKQRGESSFVKLACVVFVESENPHAFGPRRHMFGHH